MIYSTGCNDDGPLGRQCLDENGAETDDDADFTFRPVEFKAEDMQVHGKIVMVTSSDCHSAMLTEKGSVSVWGTYRRKDDPNGLMVDGPNGQIIRKAISSMVKILSGTDNLAMLDHVGSIWTIGAVTVMQHVEQRLANIMQLIINNTNCARPKISCSSVAMPPFRFMNMKCIRRK
uniref:Regulator of chromosome condensation 1/beta-lactamase-inhibitor protein II n=1 Tax=Trichuris muris TaxID=70415 RepID=A0A5S6QBX2_TRIMR